MPATAAPQIYFGTGVMGSPSGPAKLGARRGADPGAAVRRFRHQTFGARRRRLQRRRAAAKPSPARTMPAACKARRNGSALPASRARRPKSASPRRSISRRAASRCSGQEAVAQVVMNRVFSGYYPHDVCGVVFQNADRHLACQFTFACEGKDLSRIDEPDMWEQAKQIAKDTLDGKIWLADIGHATHYHAYWVHPSWVHEMSAIVQARRPHLLSAARLGRRRRRAGLGPGRRIASQADADDAAGRRRQAASRDGRSDREAEASVIPGAASGEPGIHAVADRHMDSGTDASLRSPGMTVTSRCRGRCRDSAPNA